VSAGGPDDAGACFLDLVTGSRGQIRIDATFTVPW